ncbi:MAG: hypothetical protein HN337_01520 [Deltaproteobacteria bacterium]|jgi:hypothetical protein|nr:hypothetical protein [Deltaproteobacteria bacterium]
MVDAICTSESAPVFSETEECLPPRDETSPTSDITPSPLSDDNIKGPNLPSTPTDAWTSGGDDLKEKSSKLLERCETKQSSYGTEFCKDSRGEMLIGEIRDQITSGNFQGNDFVVVLVGEGHLNQAEVMLGSLANTYYFSELAADGRIDRGILRTPFESLGTCACKWPDRTAEAHDSDKPTILIYGDDHFADIPFEYDIPTAEEIEEMGYDRLVFAGEHFDKTTTLSTTEMYSHKYPSYNRFASFIDKARSQGIHTALMGLEYYRGGDDISGFIHEKYKSEMMLLN